MACIIEWLQVWYREHCDGVWEHDRGVRIDTLDNPGWSVRIDLRGTELEGAPFSSISHDRGPDDWLRIEVEPAAFVGHGDPAKLMGIVTAFRDWVERVDQGTRERATQAPDSDDLKNC